MIRKFTQAFAGARGNMIYLVSGGKDKTHQPAWYFVRVDAPKTRAFLNAVRSGAIELAQYGEVIESGYGVEPPQAILSYMRAEHGFAG